MRYNATNWSAVNNAGDYLTVLSNNTNGYFFVGIIWLIGIVITMVSLPFGVESALFAGAFAMITIGSLAWALGVINATLVIAPAVGIILFLILYISWTRR